MLGVEVGGLGGLLARVESGDQEEAFANPVPLSCFIFFIAHKHTQ